MTTHTPAILAHGLTKTFGDVHAVNCMDLTVQQGEVLALLGPNGAGKTTFLDMVLGFTSPTSGSLSVLGSSPRTAVANGSVGAVLQTGALLKDLTVEDTVHFVAGCHARHLPPREVMERAGITPLVSRRVKKCSGGEQQRLRFALALLSDPQLLILDEPTAGMDVRARAEFWDAMHAEADRGRTVVFATHYLQEASDFADRIVLMRKGRVHAAGTVAELTHEAPRMVTCTWHGSSSPHDFAKSARVEVAGVGRPQAPKADATAPHEPGATVTFSVPGADGSSDAVVHALLTERLGTDITVERASLDRLFLDLTA